MEQIDPRGWASIYIGLIFLITCALLVLVYVLSDSSSPPAGLGFYTVYFMAALLGWIAYTLQQVADVPMPLDVPAVAAILNSYILFIAASQRAGVGTGRGVLGAFAMGACFSVFFLAPPDMFVVQSVAAGLLFACVGVVSALRSWRRDNVGDAITAMATLPVVVGMPVALYHSLVNHDAATAGTLAFGAHSGAFVMVAIGFLASVVIEYQQQLSHLATEDPLTRLLNRRGLEKALRVTLAHAARERLPTSAILLDIDRIREINDSFGHETGDQVILRVAQMLQRMSRASDVVARTGGEEFILVLPHTNLEAARILAERIRESVAGHSMIIDRHRIPVTASLGVACAAGNVELDALSQQAERALHLAKQGGPNRIASVDRNPVRLSTNTGPT